MKHLMKAMFALALLAMAQSAYADTKIKNVTLVITDKEWTGEKYILSGGVTFTAIEDNKSNHVSCPFQALKISFDEIYKCEGQNYKVGLNLIRAHSKGTAMSVIVYSGGIIAWPYKDSVTVTPAFDNEWHLKTSTSAANATPYRRH